MTRYRRFMEDGGLVHVKTDSNFLYTYTRCMAEHNQLPIHVATADLYHTPGMDERLLSIQTYYESMWMERGIDIKYICLGLPREGELSEPDVEIPMDEYRSYHREKRSPKETAK